MRPDHYILSTLFVIQDQEASPSTQDLPVPIRSLHGQYDTFDFSITTHFVVLL
jgi:hypothetical protein